MRTLQISIPENIELTDYDFSLSLASKLYADGKLSAGQAAQIAGLSKRAFIELLGEQNISIFSDKIQDLHREIENA